MTRFLALASLFLALPLAALPAVAQSDVEGPLNRVLGAVVQPDGRVNYALLARSHRADLDAALSAIASQDPGALRTDAQKTAFLVNAYNARVLERVLAHPRATNLERQSLFGAFFETPFPIAGTRATLNQIEHGALRRQRQVDGGGVPAGLRALRPSRLDPRIHVALNCAALSCPRLQPRAFSASSLNATLDRAMREWTGSSRFATASGGTVTLSSLADWYGADWETRQRPLGDALLAAMPANRRDAAAIRSALRGKTRAQLKAARDVRFAYDWTVNRAR
ncbi:DUF547 domain-containing protein [Rubricoccus marinus]|uniref:DUF547 domain-containing protein n=1 Tax=Rubricoccus marinus TaxID=716817 RepID=A0A259TZV0_9BACT|nr:DUF547 domain-containing protein [Rubricoccus marinus]OZC03220.1 hypothetical protein BSZ36_09675 [Rubricoccus marinus]